MSYRYHFIVSNPSEVSVLVPGAGLGRLAWEIAHLGMSLCVFYYVTVCVLLCHNSHVSYCVTVHLNSHVCPTVLPRVSVS